MRKYLALVVLGLALGSLGQAQSLPDQLCMAKGSSLAPVGEQTLWLSGEGAQSLCQAQCANGTSVSTQCSGTCTAVDANCPETPYGYVACNGVYTYCSAACQSCTGPSCEGLHDTYCSPRGSETSCCSPDGLQNQCFCGFGNKWICPI